eukprot:scaffold369_cov177-Ochromonas_danica.AAC.41
MSNIEADEVFARRLQVQELGGFAAAVGSGAVDNPNAQTPLMRDRVNVNGTIPPGNPTVLNARMTEISTSWATVFVISMVNIPQILAGIVVLALHWNSDHTCDSGHMIRWKWWAGASQNVIDSIPVITISSDHLSNGQIPTCPICLNEMALGESARSLRCGHLFHQQCVDEWLRVNATCPTCRKSVREDATSSDNSPTAGDGGSTNALPPSNMTNMTISINISGAGTATNNPMNSAPSYALL